MSGGWYALRGAAIVLGACVFATGCYTYVPASFTAVPIGETVRVYLSQAGVDSLRHAAAEALPDLGDRPVVSGKLVRRDAADFSLQIPVATRRQGFMQAELDQRVSLPVAALVQVEQKKVSGVRSALAVVASTALLATLVVTILNGARDPTGETGPEPDNLRVP